MNAFEHKRFIPGHRGLIRDIGEAGGPLVLLDELIDEEGLGMVVKTFDMGVVVFATGDALLVSRGDFLIYREMVERIEDGSDDDDGGDEEIEGQVKTAA